jgi:hypothetical protein
VGAPPRGAKGFVTGDLRTITLLYLACPDIAAVLQSNRRLTNAQPQSCEDRKPRTTPQTRIAFILKKAVAVFAAKEHKERKDKNSGKIANFFAFFAILCGKIGFTQQVNTCRIAISAVTHCCLACYKAERQLQSS